MKIREAMNKKAAYIEEDVNLKNAAKLINFSRASELIVVDKEHHFIGTLPETALIDAMIPDASQGIQEDDNMQNLIQRFLERKNDLINYPITELINKNAITIHPDDNVISAARIMVEKQIRLLPVIESGKVIGTISRAEICWALMCHETTHGNIE